MKRENDGWGWRNTLRIAGEFAFVVAACSAAGAIVGIVYVRVWCP